MTDISTVLHLLDEARGFAALSPAGRENISEAIDILEAINTRPAAPVEGLETVRREYRWGGDTKWKPFGPIFDDEPRETRELVTRSQAEAIIAAERAEKLKWMEHSFAENERVRNLEANNAALTARVKELEADVSAYILSAEDQDKRRKALETQLAAALGGKSNG